jgi:ERCC4-type nuclease
VVIDRREQDPLPFSRLKTRPGTLATGDYSILGTEELFAVERKTLPDLVACCAGERERFSRELHRLRGYRFKRLVVIGSEAEILAGQYRSLVSPRAALATLYCFEVRFDLPFVFCADALQAGRLIERWALWFARELYKNANGLLLGAGEIRNARSSKIGRSNKHETDQYRHIDMLLP